MSRSGYISHHSDMVVGNQSKVMPAPPNSGLGEWEQTDPCRYSDQSCRGKLFGALKSCRRRRERSQALCQAHEQALVKQSEYESEREEMMQALQRQVTQTAKQQDTAGSTMTTGLAVGGVALAGAVAILALKKKK